MNDAARCSSCGSHLPGQGVTSGLCPRCLLQLGLESPTSNTPDLAEYTGQEPTSQERFVAHYQIVRQIGKGGMADVFLALDTKLRRKVALKLLAPRLQKDPAARERFLREARVVAELDHPHICRVFEIGISGDQDFIAMEYIEGKTLHHRLREGRLPLSEALRLADEVASALERAGEVGIVHRDLKPSNIMFTAGGRAKVLDFGLVKRASSQSGEEGNRLWFSGLTETGSIVGTPAYMSPEQLRGKPLDCRSDIFSLGIVLYEAVTGRHPFLRESRIETVNAILSSRFPVLAEALPEAPPQLGRTLSRMLAKEPGRRYSNFRQVRASLDKLISNEETTGFRRLLAEALRPELALTAAAIILLALLLGIFLSLDSSRETVPAGQPEESALKVESPPKLVVLPLENVDKSLETQFLSVGLTDALVNRLSAVGNLLVIEHPAVSTDPGTGPLFRYLRELPADYVLKGSFRKSQRDLFISTGLTRLRDEARLWTSEYRVAWSELAATQEEIAEKVAAAINPSLKPVEKGTPRAFPVHGPGAYEAYLHGRFFLAQRSTAALENAIDYFGRTLEIDPLSAPAYAGLSEAYLLLGATGYGGRDPKETMPRAERAARKALEIDPKCGEAHASLGAILMSYRWDWEGADTHFLSALELSPGNSTTHHWYGLYLAARGQLDDSLREIQLAHSLDPLSPAVNSGLARCRYYRREYDGALLLYKKALELDPDFAPAHLGQALTYLKQLEGTSRRGDQLELLLRSVTAFENSGSIPVDTSTLLATLLKGEVPTSGWESADPPFFSAVVYTVLDRPAEALEWLQRAAEARSEYLVFLDVEPLFDRLRNEPAFGEILSSIGLDRREMAPTR